MLIQPVVMLLHALVFPKILPLFSVKSLIKLAPAFKWSEKKIASKYTGFAKLIPVVI